MSFIGNIAAAQSAKAIGKYNQSVLNQQSALQKAKTEVNRKVYNDVDRPRLVKNQNAAYDFLFVQALKSGAEVREGSSNYEVLMETKINQATDLAIEDYNSTTAYYDGINQSILLASKGVGERFKGYMTANTQYMQAIGSMFGNYRKSGSILSS
tara:strand:- start:228 stop:689 length:462 start_codon:yes stop_codon:yes gene_type:complete